VDSLAGTLVLGSLLDELTQRYGGFDVLSHWTQGEFHHDLVVRLPDTARAELSGVVLVIATNCNGGIKELFLFDDAPARGALWHHRCPDVAEFSGALPRILAHAKTHHWFDPRELLGPDARSELRPECRRRQSGGGWEQVPR
jgi:hypothetical protein